MTLNEIRARRDQLATEYVEHKNKQLYPSQIGQQFYCEQTLDLREKHGDVETEEKTKGTEVHKKAAEDAVEVSDDELWEGIESGDLQIIVESGFVGDAAEFYLGGKPDAIVFENQKPQVVFDRKTSSRPSQVYDNQRIQVWLYGFILDRLGFDTEDLRIGILSHSRDLGLERAKVLQQELLSDYPSFGVGDHKLDDNVFYHVFDYSRIEYLNELNWALGYWRDERPTEPTTNPAKCHRCEYLDVCSATPLHE
ncbi:hypothetical protein C5B90_02995 [Haloferax sp. Atlit-12N]|uniref:PD-(D/E)XK nuclease family protein n=1 Tax=Haloferax sp. Atlit-12N TaxID=2077203 RepID=UPI000E24C9FA|nr:PD-(D/E)XK nuclease family protein [Haloferax sp. Atlit-12N]RDZ65348.1 hypothetical protein C5B90_02995 [Haloferax sp. Atlit-12N]